MTKENLTMNVKKSALVLAGLAILAFAITGPALSEPNDASPGGMVRS